MRHQWFVVLMLVLTSCGQPIRDRSIQDDVFAAESPFATSLASPSIVLSDSLTRTVTLPADVPLPIVSPTAPLTVAPAAALPTPSLPAPSPVVIVPHTILPQSNQQRWRAQQVDRQVLTPAQVYVASVPVEVQWFDPLVGHSVVVGRLIGAFPVQATFRLRSGEQRAVELPYRIGVDYGLTALSPVLIERLRAAGYTEFAEVYVVLSDAVQAP